MRNSVRARRLAAGWSQARLAELLGVTRLTVISIEKERFDPSLPLAFRISSVFDAPIEEIFDPEGAAP
ncbi:putative transcriptional regulator [Sediminihabitans luteus]|uniref:Putative transcriptional regulator n=1 Tax=Sediminihabitans luteus TaxID=1138585 RepID=A0A2M9D021_9CELL|nr:helix-turn-helix transcriptional regulator [Sediminihabitans luteus]PJJ77541.1 putative transcriptional regulator [Sediminihabitans luteus]GII98440.1 transcriptional regulator [Sediminihabitans luteus]